MLLSLPKILLVVMFTVGMGFLSMLVFLFNRSARTFTALTRFYSRGVLAISGVRVDVEGLERIDFSRSYIYVANHTSLFDIPAVVVGIPDRFRIVYKKSLEKIPFFGWGLKAGGGYISIERTKGLEAAQSLEQAAERIRTGASVLLFAEGTRSHDGTLQPFKRGPFYLAVRSGVPVVPVTINGSYDVLPRHSWLVRSGTITLVLSDPIQPPRMNGKETELELRDRVRSVIQQNLRKQRR